MNRKQRYNEDPEYREKEKLRFRKYASNNKEKIKEKNTKYREKMKQLYENDEELLEKKQNYYREYQKNNREKKAEANRKYREKIKAKKEAEKMKNLYIEDENLKIQII